MSYVIIGFIVVVIISVVLLKQFDKIAGRGPKQIKDGINQSMLVGDDRIECPKCAEMIKPNAKKCRFCGSEL